MIVNEVKLLNETILECLNESDEVKVIKTFTDVGVKVLEADYGFTWLNSADSKNFKLIYKSKNLPFVPHPPRKHGRNFNAIKNATPDFVTKTKLTPDAQYVSKHIKSFVIIPLVYKKQVYGTTVICFKKPEFFLRGKKTLSALIGNSLAQAITIRRLVVKQKEEHKKEIALKETKILLSQEKIKTEFIANTTHELRTPLAIIKGNIDLVLKKNSKKSNIVKTTFDSIDYEINHLSSVISDLALITSKKNLKLAFDREWVDLHHIIPDILKRCKPLAVHKGISIKVESIPKLSICGDKIYLEKMLINLVANSIFYGKPGGKTIVSVKKTKGSVEINVADNGIGISKQDLPFVFDRFYRADKSHNSNEEGHTGLGLSIVKWVVDFHRGRISVKSKVGEGTIFTVYLPINISKK